MAEIYVTPDRSDGGAAVLLIVISLLVFVVIIGYAKGWFSRVDAVTPAPGSSVNIMTPVPATTTLLTPVTIPTAISDRNTSRRN